VGTFVTEARTVEGAGGQIADLYQRHVPAAGRLAYLLTGDRAQAEDLVQDAFVRVMGRFGHLRVPDAFESYLRRTIVNLHTSSLRRRRLERAYLIRTGRRAEPSSPMPDVGAREDLWRALRELTPRQRAAIVLRFYEDLSERETAAVLRCSPAAVKSLVARAMETLRATIGSEPR
jgi:RNA polymerase sigma-70 factor (sigma-E family)